MPFIPHTEKDVSEMLSVIGAGSLEQLFDEVPEELLIRQSEAIPEGISEMELMRLMKERAACQSTHLCFIGAGAYEHHIPAAVWDTVSRAEFMTAYTPYQAEASQGNLQLIFEFQTMIANLTGLDCANASLYDGATALAESVLMAVRANKSSKTRHILIPSTVHPAYRRVVHSIVHGQNIAITEIPFCPKSGHVVESALADFVHEDITAVIIPQNNFFGILEDVDMLTDWAHQRGALAIALVNPMALAMLKSPHHWGIKGADIACGEGQPLGIPLSAGGPYIGFMVCKREFMRQIPGRIVGKTTDSDGQIGYTLTLQAREQHIRRSKATSNICTNQGLLVAAASVYLSLLGAEGLSHVAMVSHANTRILMEELCTIPGVQRVFNRPIFHEAVIRLNDNAEKVLEDLADQHIVGGYNLGNDYPELKDCILICATETKTKEDVASYSKALREVLGQKSANNGKLGIAIDVFSE